MAGTLTIVVTFVAIGLARLKFGSIAVALAYVRGDEAVVVPASSDFGRLSIGETAALSYRLTNLSDRPIRLMGSQSSCDCTLLAGLPRTVNSGDSLDLKATLRTSKETGVVTGRIRVFTDSNAQSEVVLAYTGSVDVPRGSRAEP